MLAISFARTPVRIAAVISFFIAALCILAQISPAVANPIDDIGPLQDDNPLHNNPETPKLMAKCSVLMKYLAILAEAKDDEPGQKEADEWSNVFLEVLVAEVGRKKGLDLALAANSDYEPRVDAILDSDEKDLLEDPLIASDIESCIELMSLE